MTQACLQPKYLFGFKGGVKAPLHFLDEHTIAYPNGSNCVIYNIDMKSQNFIPKNVKGQSITCIGVSNNHASMAIAEKADRPIVTIYDTKNLKKLKSLVTNEVASKEYISLSFSCDDKFLVAQGGAPDWTLTYWQWEKNRLLTSICSSNLQILAPVNQIMFHPFDITIVMAVGNAIFRMFKMVDGTLRPAGQHKYENYNYTCALWISEERMVVGTDSGNFIVFENGDPKGVIPVSKMIKTDSQRKVEKLSEYCEFQMIPLHEPVEHILHFSKGLIVACGQGGAYVFEKSSDEREYYKQTRFLKIPQDPQSAYPAKAEEQVVNHIAISPNEEILIICTDRLQLYCIFTSSFEISKTFQSTFEFLAQPFHYESIIGLDVCVRKPLIITCSVDHSVRVWNYDTCSHELHREFTEEVLSVCIHPTGMFIIVGFNDCIRLMNLLIDDIRTFKEISLRTCRECCFSNGGSMFAATHGNIIQLFSAVTFDLMHSLKGHHSKVNCLTWSLDDTVLVSCGADGAVYNWESSSGKRIGDSVLKGCNYICAALTPDNKVVVTITADKHIKEIVDSQILRQVSTKEVMTYLGLSHSGRYFFASGDKGCIWSIKFPLTVLGGDFLEFSTQSGLITKMKITLDDQYLITASSDASLCIWKIVDREGRSLKREKELTFAAETLITRTELEEKNSIIAELRQRVNELITENEYQMRLKDLKYAERMREISEKYSQDMEIVKSKLTDLEETKERQTQLYEDELRTINDKFSKELEDQESLSNQKLILEYEKYHDLQNWSSRMQEDYEKKLADLEVSKEHALEDLTGYYENKLHENTTMLEQAQEQTQMHFKESEEVKKQIEEDADREIMDIKLRYEKKLKEERETNTRLKAEAALLKKKFLTMQKEIDEHKLEMQRAQQEQQKLQNTIKGLEKDISALRKEIEERDETIQDKENRIYDLKKKNQELEKFKFVLDYKIKELKKQLDPKDNQIREMHEQIAAMEVELNSFRLENQKLELEIKELRQKMLVTDKEMHEQKLQAKDMEISFDRLKADIYKSMDFIQNPKQLKESLLSIYKKHVHKEMGASLVEDDLDILSEYARQREHLEHTLTSLRKKLNKDTKLHQSDYIRIMQQNVMLIKEINDLRQELKYARSQLDDLEKMLQVGKDKINKGEIQAKIETIINQVNEAVAERDEKLTERENIIEVQRQEINRLHKQIQTYNQTGEAATSIDKHSPKHDKKVSRKSLKLPPVLM